MNCDWILLLSKELKEHIENIKKKFGEFNPAPHNKVNLCPKTMHQQLMEMIPGAFAKHPSSECSDLESNSTQANAVSSSGYNHFSPITSTDTLIVEQIADSTHKPSIIESKTDLAVEPIVEPILFDDTQFTVQAYECLDESSESYLFEPTLDMPSLGCSSDALFSSQQHDLAIKRQSNAADELDHDAYAEPAKRSAIATNVIKCAGECKNAEIEALQREIDMMKNERKELIDKYENDMFTWKILRSYPICGACSKSVEEQYYCSDECRMRCDEL